WMWVRASGPPGRRIVLFDYDASRGGAVPKRLLQDYRGILLSDGWEPYATVAQELGLVHAGCLAHARRKFDEARKATPGDSGHARTALDFIRELYLIEHTLWDRERPVTPARRVEVRSMRSAPVVTRFHAWLEALSSQVLPESRLGKAVHYTPDERVMGWYYYLEGKLRFPFTATCIKRRATSPFKIGESLSVTGLAPEQDCMSEIIVITKYHGRALGVPLAQLRPRKVDAAT